MTAAFSPPVTALRVPQGADWPGISIPIYDSDGVLRTSLDGCTVSGSIRRTPDSQVLFTWSTDPAEGQGSITFSGGYVVLSIAGSLSSAFTWRRARWQLDLTVPTAPVGQQVVRIGQGPIVVDPNFNT